VVLLLRTIHPMNLRGARKLRHFLDPTQKVIVLAQGHGWIAGNCAAGCHQLSPAPFSGRGGASAIRCVARARRNSMEKRAFGSDTGIRTRILALRGLRPNPSTISPMAKAQATHPRFLPLFSHAKTGRSSGRIHCRISRNLAVRGMPCEIFKPARSRESMPPFARSPPSLLKSHRARDEPKKICA